MRSSFNIIQPGDVQNINYWTKRWGVSSHELSDAIVSTGSIDPDAVHTFLKKDSWLHHPFEKSWRAILRTYQSFSE